MQKLITLCRLYGCVSQHSEHSVPVIVNGFFCGYMDDSDCDDEGRKGQVWEFTQMLREMKCKAEIEPTTEIIYVCSKNRMRMFPILNILTMQARYTRPVYNL